MLCIPKSLFWECILACARLEYMNRQGSHWYLQDGCFEIPSCILTAEYERMMSGKEDLSLNLCNWFMEKVVTTIPTINTHPLDLFCSEMKLLFTLVHIEFLLFSAQAGFQRFLHGISNESVLVFRMLVTLEKIVSSWYILLQITTLITSVTWWRQWLERMDMNSLLTPQKLHMLSALAQISAVRSLIHHQHLCKCLH